MRAESCEEPCHFPLSIRQMSHDWMASRFASGSCRSLYTQVLHTGKSFLPATPTGGGGGAVIHQQ